MQMDNVTSALMMRTLLEKLRDSGEQRFHCPSALGMVTDQTGPRSGFLDLELCNLRSASHLHAHSKKVFNRLGDTEIWWNLNCAFSVQCLICRFTAEKVLVFVG